MLKLFGKKPRTQDFNSTIELGAFGETVAMAALKQRGYRLVVTNYTAPLGRNRRGQPLTGEIDIIAYDEEGVLCFIEVKTRTSALYAAPQAAVDLRKQRQIIRTSRVYRRVFQLSGEAYRYDVVSVLLKPDAPEVTLLQGYFTNEKFQRSHWLRGY
ncbi:MAG: YraN family protein [Blastocatellia bacterium]